MKVNAGAPEVNSGENDITFDLGLTWGVGFWEMGHGKKLDL
jgi:hypothetical protein